VLGIDGLSRLKKKKRSFEIAVTNPLDARTYFWMNFQGAGASLAI
jgi:hypothetical protein